MLSVAVAGRARAAAARAPVLRAVRHKGSNQMTWEGRTVYHPTRDPLVPKSDRLQAISHDIFGTMPAMHDRTGNKYLRAKLKGEYIADYYFDHSYTDMNKVGRQIMSGWLDEQQEHRLEKLDSLRRRGKGPPKKGQGKRAMKAAKKKK